MALLAGFLSGIIGAMGMGGGAVLIIYLTLFENVKQIEAQGLNLFFFIPIAVLALIIYSKKREIDWKTTFPIALGGIFGALGGYMITNIIGENFLGKIFGGLLILLGALEIFKKEGKKEKSP